MQVNNINSVNNTSFGAKLNGTMITDLCKEVFTKKGAKLANAYTDQFAKLEKVGSKDSEIYLSVAKDGMNRYILRNSKLSSEYETLLATSPKGNMVEGFLKIKLDDVLKAEDSIKLMIQEKRQFLSDSLKVDDKFKKEVLEKTKSKDIKEALDSLSDKQIVDLYFAKKDNGFSRIA